MKSPFQFLDAFSAKDKERFFGRDQEIEKLYKLVNQNRMTLVYGQSGTGKTSLVKCGLAGRYNPVDWFPIFVRRGQNLNSSLREALLSRIPEELEEELTVPELIEEVYDYNLRPVYLIFDQFEELFVLGSEKEQKEFFQTIQRIINARISCRLIIIQREEYLAHLYRFEDTVPTLLDSRLRVELMSPQKIGMVIEQSCEKFNITLEHPQTNIQQIINNLKGEQGFVQLPFLQVYLDLFYREDYQRTYPEGNSEALPALTFQTEEIEQFGRIGQVLATFLKNQEQEIQAMIQRDHQEMPADGVRKLLDAFVTAEGTKRPVSYEKKPTGIELEEVVQQRIPFRGKVLEQTLFALSKRRILRDDEKTFELAHDSLAPLIESQRSGEQRLLNELRASFHSSFKLHQRDNTQYLSPKLLHQMDPYVEELGLEPIEQDYIAQSKAHWVSRRRRTRVLTTSIIAVLSVLTLWAVLNAQRATKALSNLSQATDQIFENLLVDFEDQVLQLNYESAQAKLLDAISLNKAPERTAKHLMELVFYYGESKQYDKALALLETLNRLYSSSGRSLSFSGADTLAVLRAHLASLDKDTYQKCKRRYFPEMVNIKGGTYSMGCDSTVFPRCQANDLHQVQLNDFKIAKFETTNWQYHLYCVATGKDSIVRTKSSWALNGHLPVVKVNWVHVHDYLSWLNEQNDYDNPFQIVMEEAQTSLDIHINGYRLPTEAEWEYAAKANQPSFIFSGGHVLADQGWYGENSGFTPKPVGTKSTNDFQTFDQSGNVWEWVWDQLLTEFVADSLYLNPLGAEGDVFQRTLKGGSFSEFEDGCTVFNRRLNGYSYDDEQSGFRVAMSQ